MCVSSEATLPGEFSMRSEGQCMRLHVGNGLVQQRDQGHAKKPELERDESDVLALGVFDAVSLTSQCMHQLQHTGALAHISRGQLRAYKHFRGRSIS